MKKIAKDIVKSAAFILCLVLLLGEVNKILLFKAVEYRRYSPYSQYEKFYEMETDSIDVLFAGSSHSYCSFSPQDFYDQFKIRSYNLGSSRQDVWISYYWIREALRFQKPKAVILETFYIFGKGGEPFVRRSLDYMKWSSVKKEAVSAARQEYPEITAASFYLPNIRFHERWKEVGEDDFLHRELAENYELKGYSAIGKKCGEETYQPFSSDTEEKEEISEDVSKYLDKIVGLCKENNVELLFVSNPAKDWSVQQHNAVAEYARQQGIEYYDFNTQELYIKSGYNFSEDNGDAGHSNIWGAEKITRAMGEILQQSYQIEGTEDKQWEETKEYYENIKKDYALKYETDINKYLPLLSDPRYSVLISVKDEAVNGLTEEITGKLRALGLQTDFNGKIHNSYYAVILPDHVIEEISAEALSTEGTLRGGLSSYYVSSAGYLCGNNSSILIDGIEYSVNSRGLNVVVYNNENNEVIDAVCFDTYEGLKATRKNIQ